MFRDQPRQLITSFLRYHRRTAGTGPDRRADLQPRKVGRAGIGHILHIDAVSHWHPPPQAPRHPFARENTPRLRLESKPPYPRRRLLLRSKVFPPFVVDPPTRRSRTVAKTAAAACPLGGNSFRNSTKSLTACRSVRVQAVSVTRRGRCTLLIRATYIPPLLFPLRRSTHNKALHNRRRRLVEGFISIDQGKLPEHSTGPATTLLTSYDGIKSARVKPPSPYGASSESTSKGLMPLRDCIEAGTRTADWRSRQ